MKCEKEQKEYAIISVRDRLIQTMKTRSVNDLAPLIADDAVVVEIKDGTGFNPVYKSFTVKGKPIRYERRRCQGNDDAEFLRDDIWSYNKCFFGFSIIQHNERR